MHFELTFVLNSFFLGVGLAMDAFSVSMADGLNYPNLKKNQMFNVAAVFGFFQFTMPFIGWICLKTIMNSFKIIEKFIPYIALILLLYIGIKMIIESIKEKKEKDEKFSISIKLLILQGIATSIDALSVGFTIVNYGIGKVMFACIIIGIITFVICVCGILIGKKFGTLLSNKAQILGGIILIIIGIEIFIKGNL